MNAPVEVWNGMLRVADDKAFEELIKSLDGKNEEELVRWSDQMGYKSLVSSQISTSSARIWAGDDLFPEPDEFISDSRLASMLNTKGEIVIGDLKFRVTEEVTYMYEPNKEDVVNRLSIHEIDGKIDYESFTEVAPGVWAGKVSRQATSSQPNGRIKWLGKRDEKHHYFRSDRRFVAVTWNENYLIFASVGSKTKNQNRNAGIWWRSNANYLRMDLDFIYSFKDPMGVVTDVPGPTEPEIDRDKGKINFIVDWATMKAKYGTKKGPGAEPAKPFKMKYFRVRHEVHANGSIGVLHTSL